MEGLWVSIIATLLSGIFFSFLLHILNHKIWGVFVPMQRDLGNLSNTNRRILNFACYLLSILISVFLRISLGIDGVLSSLILGFMISIVDICFRDNIIYNITKQNKV
nr:hypothetical protein [uncultured Romboutsia sp.]